MTAERETRPSLTRASGGVGASSISKYIKNFAGSGSFYSCFLWVTCLCLIFVNLASPPAQSAISVQIISAFPLEASFSAPSLQRASKSPFSLRVEVEEHVKNWTVVDSVAHARFPNGSQGYVADATLVPRLHRKQEPYSFFSTLFKENDNGERENSTSMKSICGIPGGQGLEDTGGWQLLTKKVQIMDVAVSSSAVENSYRRPKLLCSIYTHSNQRHLARVAALSYGIECDGFLAFSNETIPSWGMVDIVHVGPESYHNMWHKVQAIWKYIGQHYLDDYDYFHLGGDDMYVLVDNLRYFLWKSEKEMRTIQEPQPMFFGQWVRQKMYPYVAGGPGYTLNRVAVQRLSSIIHTCFPDSQVSYEDRLISQCLRIRMGVYPRDSRDHETGEQLYHDVPPHQVFTSRPASGRRASFHARGMAYWETLPHPLASSSLLLGGGTKDDNSINASATLKEGTQQKVPEKTLVARVGPKYGLEAAGRYSVTFHGLHSPQFMARIHAIVHRLCPVDTPLGKSLAET